VPKAAVEQVKPEYQSTAPVASPTREPSMEVGSLDVYFSKRRELTGRFHELEAFDSSMLGKEVHWRGHVASVSERNNFGGSVILLILTATPDRVGTLVSVTFPLDQKVKLYSLRKDDLVDVAGTVVSVDGLAPMIEGKTVMLVTK
jgi:hypothetical protein